MRNSVVVAEDARWHNEALQRVSIVVVHIKLHCCHTLSQADLWIQGGLNLWTERAREREHLQQSRRGSPNSGPNFASFREGSSCTRGAASGVPSCRLCKCASHSSSTAALLFNPPSLARCMNVSHLLVALGASTKHSLYEVHPIVAPAAGGRILSAALSAINPASTAATKGTTEST